MTHTSMFGTVCGQSIERELGVDVPRTHQTDTDPSGSQLTPQTVEIAVQCMFRGGVCGRERERERERWAVGGVAEWVWPHRRSGEECQSAPGGC